MAVTDSMGCEGWYETLLENETFYNDDDGSVISSENKIKVLKSIVEGINCPWGQGGKSGMFYRFCSELKIPPSFSP